MVGYLRGQIAKMADINFETLRYYERQGLIPPPERTPSGYRIYSEEVLNILGFIKSSRESGMTIQEIQGLLTADSRNVDLALILQFLAEKIADIDHNIEKLVKTRTILQELKNTWEEQGLCPGVAKFIGIQRKNK